MNNRQIINISKYGAITSFIGTLLTGLFAILSEIGIGRHSSNYYDNDFFFVLIFCFGAISFGFLAVGVLFNLSIISEEMQINRYLKQREIEEVDEEEISV